MTDHAECLNAILADLFDAYDKSDSPITKEDVLEALTWSMVGILRSIQPPELRRLRIKLYQKALELADTDEDTSGSGVMQYTERG